MTQNALVDGNPVVTMSCLKFDTLALHHTFFAIYPEEHTRFGSQIISTCLAPICEHCRRELP